MELLQFKYFCDAAQTENFSKTAKKYGVPPSAVSHSIRRLEDEIGVKLFTRQNNVVYLNEKGRQFYTRISAALSEIRGAIDEVQKNTSFETIRICVNAHRALVTKILAKFQKLYPNIDMQIVNFHDPHEEEFDFVIASDEVKLDSFDRYKIISDELAVAINESNPIANRKDFDVSMLRDEPFIILQKPSSMNDIAHNVCRSFGFEPHISIQTDDPSYISEFLRLGLGVCIVAVRSAEQWNYPKSVLLKPIEGCTRNTYVYFSGKKLSAYKEKLLDMLIKEFK
ncbi:MAG: LysR family transcriptional regulator [Ruminococcaceae bacterium]|nr:LysR family transcriptional regulator [Oscillospiraceae bacterium]